METVLIALSYWLHALASLLFVGHYLLLALVYLPVFGEGSLDALREGSRRSRPWLYAAMGVFALTGTHLTLVDPGYLGIGHFANPWSLLMLVKHLLIAGMFALGFWFNAIQRVASLLVSNTGAPQALARFRAHANLMAALGALVLLLTAVAQAL